METVASWRSDTVGESAVKALKKNGFDAVYVKTSAEAAEIVARHLKKGSSIGFGGSMTVKNLGIQVAAAAAGCELLDHNAPGLAPEAKTKILKR